MSLAILDAEEIQPHYTEQFVLANNITMTYTLSPRSLLMLGPSFISRKLFVFLTVYKRVFLR